MEYSFYRKQKDTALFLTHNIFSEKNYGEQSIVHEISYTVGKQRRMEANVIFVCLIFILPVQSRQANSPRR
jgi:hypothetical protein